MSNTPAIPRPTPSACPECGTTRVVAEGLNTMRVARVDAGAIRQGIAAANSGFWVLGCQNCGHTAFHAKNPGRLDGWPGTIAQTV